jgi:hypothetical protein
MKDNHALGQQLVKSGERLLIHTLAVILGFVLMIVGIGMGVTMVLLPVGIPVGLFGLGLWLWGLYSTATPSKTEPSSR